jgi:hypothetical protein
MVPRSARQKFVSHKAIFISPDAIPNPENSPLEIPADRVLIRQGRFS